MVRPPQAPRAPDRNVSGFTIVELMTVIVIVGLMAGAAVVLIKPTSYARSARGYASAVTALCEAARQRAVASNTYQRIEVTADGVVHVEADAPGMTLPDSFSDEIARVDVPEQVVVASFDTITHVTDDTDVPEEGAGLPGAIDFAPDGTASAGTIFVTDSSDDHRARVAVYRASGSVYTYQDW